MSKKNFTGGLNSLLGDQPEKPKRGRPVTQTKELNSSSQEGTKEKETRATFIINEELLDKLKARGGKAKRTRGNPETNNYRRL